MSQAVATRPSQAKGFTTVQRLRGWLGNPWGKPRFLVLITWGYIFWSIAPVLVAIQFSFNNSRSLSVWHGFTTKWYLTDPIYSVRYSPDLRGALAQSMKLAVLDVVAGDVEGRDLGEEGVRIGCGARHGTGDMRIEKLKRRDSAESSQRAASTGGFPEMRFF